LGNLKNLTALYVEDEESLRKALQDAIGDEFASFILARDGDEGLKKYKKYKPDIVITDISMPICDGLTMAKDIKKLSKETPIIIFSAYSEKEKLLEAIDTGIDKYLIKPIDPDELMKILIEKSNSLFLSNQLIELGNNYQFDKNRKILINNNKTISLTKKELLFISILIRNIGAFVPHEDLKKHVWINKNVTDSAIRTFVKRVREKTSKEFIKNVPGLGYKILIDELNKV